jgi:5'-nucleotidase
MPYPIEKKLVVGVSSTALFDLHEEERMFEEKGIKEYRIYQTKNISKILNKGVAFPFIKRYLHINHVYKNDVPIEVVLISKNSPETGVRIFNSIKHYELDITRAAFTSGESPYRYIPAFNISLFLSTNETDVINAINSGYPAGRIISTHVTDKEIDNPELRVAFDFDGVIADDESERVYTNAGGVLDQYHQYETSHVNDPHSPGPLADFFKKLALFQRIETSKKDNDPTYKKIIKTAIITARNSPSHERAINTLKYWGVSVDDMFLLGGIEKRRILEVYKPHLYFDDQKTHLDSRLTDIPLVHIPFGIANQILKTQ